MSRELGAIHPCGGVTVGQKATHRGTVLHYERCGGCGRCGQWVLIRECHLLAIGERAQERFESLRASRSRPVSARADSAHVEDELADIVNELLENIE